jgi:hypothetical protein
LLLQTLAVTHLRASPAEDLQRKLLFQTCKELLSLTILTGILCRHWVAAGSLLATLLELCQLGQAKAQQQAVCKWKQ